MRVFELSDPGGLRLRAHPWTTSVADSGHRYYDFKRHPELIRSSLEDLLPFRGHAFTESFYALIEWLNGPDSILESNDCAFNGVYDNESGHSERRLEASGRLMVLFRELSTNTSVTRVRGLAEGVAMALSERSPHLEAIVGVSVVDVQYTTLPGPPERQRGQQLMLSFWAWGDSEAEVLADVDRTVVNLTAALRSAC